MAYEPKSHSTGKTAQMKVSDTKVSLLTSLLLSEYMFPLLGYNKGIARPITLTAPSSD